MIAETELAVVITRRELEEIISNAARRAAEEVAKIIPGPTANRPPHVTQKQAAEILKISAPTMSRLVKNGTFKLNATGMIPIDQIDRALRAN